MDTLLDVILNMFYVKIDFLLTLGMGLDIDISL